MRVLRSRVEFEQQRALGDQFSRVRVEGADLSGLDLSNTFWTDVHLVDVSLVEADLSGSHSGTSWWRPAT